MLALKIEVDDQAAVVAGVADWGLLSFNLTANRGGLDGGSHDRLDCFVSALSSANAEHISHHLRWPASALAIGSRVTVTVVETETPDPPARRYRADHEVQENPYTEEEWREMRRKDYLQLKKEFEGDAGG